MDSYCRGTRAVVRLLLVQLPFLLACMAECPPGHYGYKCESTCARVADHVRVRYRPPAVDFSDDPKSNPGRGMYMNAAVRASAHTPLDVDTMAAWRLSGKTLVYRNYVMDTFVASDITNDYLASLAADFNAARSAGVKVILRFSYTDILTDGAPYGDAEPQRMLRHVEQLTPVVSQHVDVIFVAQAGFVGTWGEWFYTTYLGDPSAGGPSASDWLLRTQLLLMVEDMVGPTVQVQVRTPEIKRMTVGGRRGPSAMPSVTADTAHGSSSLARTAHHNDCFLASDSDHGTFVDRAVEVPYLSRDTRWVAMGGESCKHNPPRSDCPTALQELALFHFTFLDSLHHVDVLGAWKAQGCMPDIQHRLGYRIELVDASLPRVIAQTQPTRIEVRVRNTGWAAPVSDYQVHLVMKPVRGGSTCVAHVASADARTWLPAEPLDPDSGAPLYTVAANVAVPLSAQLGNYSLYLAISDSAAMLRRNAAYRIGVANGDRLFDGHDASGLNSLRHTFQVVGQPASPAGAVPASVFFDCSSEAAAALGLGPQEFPEPVPISYSWLRNRDMETDDGWLAEGTGFEYLGEIAPSAHRTMLVREGTGGATQVLSFTPPIAPSNITLYAESAAFEAGGEFASGVDDGYSIAAVCVFTSGSNHIERARFDLGTHGWESVWHTFTPAGLSPSRKITEIHVYLLYAHLTSASGNSSVEFDNVRVLIGPDDGYPCSHGWLREDTLCTLCPAGYSCVGEAKYACPAGTFSPRGHRGCDPCSCGSNFTWCSPTSGDCQCHPLLGGFDCTCQYDVCEPGAGGDALPQCASASTLDVIPFVAWPQTVEFGIVGGAATLVLACAVLTCRQCPCCRNRCGRKSGRGDKPRLALATTRSGRIVGAAFVDGGGRQSERPRSVSPAATSRLIAHVDGGHSSGGAGKTRPRRRKSWKVAKLGRGASASSRASSIGATEVRLMELVAHPNSVFSAASDESADDEVAGSTATPQGGAGSVHGRRHPSPRRSTASMQSRRTFADFDHDDGSPE